MEEKYKIPNADLDITTDLDFIDELLKAQNVEAEPEVKPMLLDIAYTLARDKLIEARRFADLTNKTHINVEDIKMAKIEKNEVYQCSPLELTKSSEGPKALLLPQVKTNLQLPQRRDCQVGLNAELKQRSTEPNLIKKPLSVADIPRKMTGMSKETPAKKP